jgi:maltose alpha-D-glucosyltransferase/alpha-amylase
MERLIRRRRECPELGWGRWGLLDAGDPAVFAHRADWDDSTVVAVHNLAGRDAGARLELGDDGALVDLFDDEQHELDDGAVTLDLPPYGAHWFRLRRPGQRLPP